MAPEYEVEVCISPQSCEKCKETPSEICLEKWNCINWLSLTFGKE